MTKKYKVAYFGAHKYAGYPLGLQNGVKNGIEEQGHILINVADLLSLGFVETSPYYFYLAFQTAKLMDPDVYIVPIGVLNAYNIAGTKWDGHFLANLLPPEKTLVIEDYLDHYRCIVKDNKPGIRTLIRHLIEHHHYQKICFLSGPETSFGARERESVYFEEMAAHNLSTEGLFYRGIFSGECVDVVEKILSDHPDVEAIACANDHMAKTVYNVMKEHALIPGKDIAVTGFDDDPMAVHMVPPLSTVRITSYDLGYAAAYEAIRICEGKPAELSVLPSQFVHRISCGEQSNYSENPYYALLSTGSRDVDAFTSILLKDIMRTASDKTREIFRKRIRRIAEKIPAVLDESKPYGAEHLIDTKDFVAIFQPGSEKYLSYERFQSAVTDCFDSLSEYLSLERRDWLSHEISFFHHTIADTIHSSTEQREWDSTQRQWWIMQIVSGALTYSDDSKRAVTEMLASIQNLGVDKVQIFEFSEPIPYMNKEDFTVTDTVYLTAEIINERPSYYDNGKEYLMNQLLGEFIPEEITPEEKNMIHSDYTVGPLVSGSEMIGVMIIGPNNLQTVELVQLYYQVGFSLKHLQMIRQEKQMIEILDKNNLTLSEQSRHDVMTGLFNRRGFMNMLEEKIGAMENGQKAAVYFMDLDGLKQINDTYGHEEGDFAIKTTGTILSLVLSENNIGRIGGDEFLGFSMNEDVSAIIAKLENYVKSFNNKESKPYSLSMSVGYREFVKDEDTWNHISQYIEEADALLYQNKRCKKDKQ